MHSESGDDDGDYDELVRDRWDDSDRDSSSTGTADCSMAGITDNRVKNLPRVITLSHDKQEFNLDTVANNHNHETNVLTTILPWHSYSIRLI